MGRAEFQFFPRNHSVGRAEYGQPCISYEDTGENKSRLLLRLLSSRQDPN